MGPLYSSRTDDAVNERLVNFESADNIDDDGYYYYYSDKKPLSISYRLKRIVSFDPFDATVGVYICFAWRSWTKLLVNAHKMQKMFMLLVLSVYRVYTILLAMICTAEACNNVRCLNATGLVSSKSLKTAQSDDGA